MEATDKKRDPVAEFLSYEQRRDAERRMVEKKWTLYEVERLRHEDVQAWGVLRPHIEASNARGDFRYPWQMSRAEFSRYVSPAHDVDVWTLAEIRAVTQDPELYKRYRSAILQAQKDGRIMVGPNGASDLRAFADETPQKQQAELDAKLLRIDRAQEAQAKLEETQKEFEARFNDNIQAGSLLKYLEKQMLAILEMSKSRTRAFDLKDWSDLESAWNTLRGKLGLSDRPSQVGQKIAGLRSYYAREDDKRAAEAETAAA